MLTAEENARLTEVGRGKPMGELLRRFWQPVGLSDEVTPGGAPVAVQVMDELLVLFRDDTGRPGLLGLRCSHRGVDLSYGRNEDGGLRCLYHGWLYDVNGRCLEQPGEPAGSTFKDKIRHLAYPCREAGGMIFAYLGPLNGNEPPVLPLFEALATPESHRYVEKFRVESNFLQSVEGGVDPEHASFLHRVFRQRDELAQFYTTSVRGDGQGATPISLEGIAADSAPQLEFESTEYGGRVLSVRTIGPGRQLVRINSYLLPNLIAVGAGTGSDGYSLGWHVPLDDHRTWRYFLTFRRSAPIDKALRVKLFEEEITADRLLVRNETNHYLQDREEMQTSTFSGLGQHVPTQDAVICALQGPIQDRSQEHLGYTDKVLLACRQAVQRALTDVEEGREPAHVVRDAATGAFAHPVVLSALVPPGEHWRDFMTRMIDQEIETAERYLRGGNPVGSA